MNKPNIFIISGPHLDVNRELWLGGLDKYTDTLAEKLAKNGFNVYFHEISVSGDFEICRNGFHEIGHNLPRNIKKSVPKIENIISCLPYYSSEKDIIIYSTDYLGAYNFLNNAIAIQHGIAWDIPFKTKKLKYMLKPHLLYKSKVHILEKIDLLVCVDYNYPNWIRATFPYYSLMKKIHIIPNFSSICDISNRMVNNNDQLKVCFARRFEDYRGVILFSDAIDLLAKKPFFSKLSFTFAGKGKEENKLRNKFSGFNNICFTKYDANKALEFHSDFDVAVIPTIGSEGTSLSALEAMSAGCAVISTGVGGLSNIIIDRFNGLIIDPTPESIAESIETLFYDRDLLSFISKKGHDVVSSSFNDEIWFKKWLYIINGISKVEEDK